jgi:hypothetical protein
MNDKKLLALYGLKWNPFAAAIPAEALWRPPGIDSFFFRLENLIMDGGFAMVCGEPGLGKSKILQLLAQRLSLWWSESWNGPRAAWPTFTGKWASSLGST